jgi:hypothetical protein
MLLNIVLLAVLAYVLVQRFRSTRNGGYLVLGVPLVLWSFVWWPVNLLLRPQIDRHLQGEAMLWPLAMLSGLSATSILQVVTSSMRLVEMALLILGFVWLGREEARAGAAPLNSALQPTAAELRAPHGGSTRG